MKEESEIKNPRVIIILSGKRKSGKDHLAGLLDRLLEQKVFLRISYPIKKQFTQMKGLNFKESLSASEYKESFRQEMITWSEQVRREDPNIFLRSAIHDECAHDFPIWVLVDARRACDLQFFKDEYPDNEYRKTFTVRIVSSEETRKKRGWSFQSGVDDVESECGLDHVSHWSIIVKNEEGTTDSMLEEQVRAVIKAASAVTATHDP